MHPPYKIYKKNIGMAKNSLSNGGLFGSGIFGFFGTTIKCDSTDETMYCSIMKIVNMFIVLLIVVYILYFVYNYIVAPALRTKRGR